MSLTTEDTKKVAHLARLQLNDKEITSYTEELSSILELVKQLDQADTNGVTPMAHPQDVTQPLREDKVTEVNHRDVMQKLAPAATAGLYLVPQVIETSEEETHA